jgi:multiple antibiotic resistance protein
MLLELLDQILLAFLAILPVVNPFAKPPIFLSITEGLTRDEQRHQALKACIYAFIILAVSLAAGTFILEFFSITLPALQIAGGLIIARTAFDMLRPQKEHHQTPIEEQESREKTDVSFVPLALPLLSGPGSIAVMINLATHTSFWADWIMIGVAAGAVCVVSYFVLVQSLGLVRVLGVNGMNALSKLMGFLLLSLAVQFMINGITAALTTLAQTLDANS